MLTNIWIAAAFAVFVWWISTGAILFFVRRADHAGPGAHRRLTFLSLPVLCAGWALFAKTLAVATPLAIYGGFLASILIWGWLELAFLCGVITGPNRSDCPPDAPEPERFLRAWGTIAHGEILLFLSLLVMWFASEGATNQTALWTFVVLYLARVSAKLNLFLGVPNINTDFLPQPVKHLASHFRHARMNVFFPVGITLLTFALSCWVERTVAYGPGSTQAVAFALLASLTALAVFEHWAMVVPLQEARLWNWALRISKTKTTRRQDKTRERM